MNNMIANIRTQLQKLKCRIANLTKRVAYIEDNCCNGGGDGIQSIQEGDNISIDNTDPQNPVISSTGGDLTLEQARQNGNVLEGDIEFAPEYDIGLSYFFPDDNIESSIRFYQDEGMVLKTIVNDHHSYISMVGSMMLGTFAPSNGIYTYIHIPTHFSTDDYIQIVSNKENFKGFVGNEEYDKQGDRKAFAQIADVEDAVASIETPTLSEVLTQDNNAEDKTIKFLYDDGNIPKTAEIGFLEIESDLGTYKKQAFGTANIHVTPTGFYSNSLYGGFNAGIVTDFDNDSNNFNIDTNQPLSKGITASQYFGANYDDNTYVQKRYVDSVVFNYALKKPTIGGTTGQVLTADRFGSYAWKDVEVQTYLQSITGYDEEATQTLKNINGVMTWVTD